MITIEELLSLISPVTLFNVFAIVWAVRTFWVQGLRLSRELDFLHEDAVKFQELPRTFEKVYERVNKVGTTLEQEDKLLKELQSAINNRQFNPKVGALTQKLKPTEPNTSRLQND